MDNAFMEKLKRTVLEAGEILLLAKDISVEKEKDGAANFVTQYDTAIQKFLYKELKTILPGATFLGEEDEQYLSPEDKKYCFIIDPIDGTKNFICDFQHSVISVALSCAGELTHGLVYNPFSRELFWAQKGKGAYLNEIRLSAVDSPLNNGVVIFGTTPYNPEFREKVFEVEKDISYLTMDLRKLGSAALELCYVACNRAVAYASPRLCIWDYAAAAVLLNELGYDISDFEGKPLNFRTKVSVIASNPTGFKQLKEVTGLYAKEF